MNSIPQQIATLFFPPTMGEQENLTFDTAVDAINRQRIARITKAAIFALSTTVSTITLVLTEVALITLPLAIPAILISLTTAGIFYRLNSLDSRYIEGLDDKKRAAVIKHELDRILLSKEAFKPTEITKLLKSINRVLGDDVFDKKATENILLAQRQAAQSKTPTSLAEIALEKNIPLAIHSASEWTIKGQYGLPSYEYKLKVMWDGKPKCPITIAYESKEVKNDQEAEEVDSLTA